MWVKRANSDESRNFEGGFQFCSYSKLKTNKGNNLLLNAIMSYLFDLKLSGPD